MSSAVFVDRDNGYAALVKAVFELEKPVVEVGILEGGEAAHGDDGASILDVAGWLEFGTDTQPPRSWLRAWFDEDEEHLREVTANLLREVLAGHTTKEQALEQLGAYAVGRIQERWGAGLDPPNAPSTIEAKGSSTPGIDTGLTRASVSFRVKEG